MDILAYRYSVHLNILFTYVYIFFHVTNEDTVRIYFVVAPHIDAQITLIYVEISIICSEFCSPRTFIHILPFSNIVFIAFYLYFPFNT